MAAARLPVLHARDSTYSYQCRACNRCCYGRRIQVNPYELARLARNLGTTTTDVIAQFTVDGGVALATRPDTACVFLGASGCTVHGDRPLACRLYPLGRIVRADATEVFIELEPAPESDGVYGEDGTVDAFLSSQGVDSYLVAADRYYAVMARLLDGGPRGERPADPGHLAGDSALGMIADDIDPRLFIDADLAVQRDAERGGAPTPRGADPLIERHLTLVGRWADQLSGTA